MSDKKSKVIMGKNDELTLKITRDIYRDVIMNAIRAQDQAMRAEGSATLAYHRLTCGKSVKQLESLDRQLAKWGDGPAAVLRARLQKRIRDEKTVDGELKAMGQRKDAQS